MTSRWFAALPNIITLCRIALTPAVVMAILSQRWRTAFAIFVIAGVSDAVDGWLAKTYRLESELGAILDPIADKALIISIFVTLAATGFAPQWLTILIVGRDFTIITAVLATWAFARPVAMRPHIASKATTAAQLSLAALLLGKQGFGFETGLADELLIGLVAALTVASACVYLWLWVKHMRLQNVAEGSAVARRAH